MKPDETTAVREQAALVNIGSRINRGIGEGSLAATRWRDALIDVGVMVDDLINEIEDAATQPPASGNTLDAIEAAIAWFVEAYPINSAPLVARLGRKP